MTPLPTLALEQFQLRRRVAQAKVTAREWTAEEADARLYPWLAMALVCGADAAQLHPQLLDTLADYQRVGNSPASARALAAMAYCPTEDMRAEIAKARDHAFRTNNPHRAALSEIADAIHCPAFTGEAEPEQEAA